jgi:hypothetical protein
MTVPTGLACKRFGDGEVRSSFARLNMARRASPVLCAISACRADLGSDRHLKSLGASGSSFAMWKARLAFR